MKHCLPPSVSAELCNGISVLAENAFTERCESESRHGEHQYEAYLQPNDCILIIHQQRYNSNPRDSS